MGSSFLRKMDRNIGKKIIRIIIIKGKIIKKKLVILRKIVQLNKKNEEK